MPLAAEYLKDHEDHKKGDKSIFDLSSFLRLKRQGIIKRVSLSSYQEWKKGKKNVNPNSLKNLKGGNKKSTAKKAGKKQTEKNQ